MQDARQLTFVTIFTAQGDHIIAGTNKGWLNIIEVGSRETVHSTRLCNGLIILLRLTASGRDMVSNASDRVIRTIPIPNLSQTDFDMENMKIEVEHKFQDVVNRLSWNHVAFSSTGDYVAASTYMNHDIYVWERVHESLVKILEGPKEELGAVEVCDLVSYSVHLSLTSLSGTRIDLLSRHAVLRQDASTSGRSLRRSDGQLWHRTSPKWKRMWSTWSEKMNSISTR